MQLKILIHTCKHAHTSMHKYMLKCMHAHFCAHTCTLPRAALVPQGCKHLPSSPQLHWGLPPSLPPSPRACGRVPTQCRKMTRQNRTRLPPTEQWPSPGSNLPGWLPGPTSKIRNSRRFFKLAACHSWNETSIMQNPRHSDRCNARAPHSHC